MSTQSYFYYEDPKNMLTLDRKKRKNCTALGNMEFELVVGFNPNKCWGLFEVLVRSISYERAFPNKLQ